MRTEFYDKNGRRISIRTWSKLIGNLEYKRVDLTILPGGYRVSTVWLGMDHSFIYSRPLVFETMVFPKDSWMGLETDRYETLEEAKKGHKDMVKRWKGLKKPQVKKKKSGLRHIK